MTPDQINVVLKVGESLVAWIIGGGLTLILGYAIARYKARTERQASLTSSGAEIVTASAEIISELRDRIAKLEQWKEDSEKDRESQSRRISILESIVSIWSAWWNDLEVHWQYHRTKDAPPPRPLIPKLKEDE